MSALLGEQAENGTITRGKIDFLDVWPIEAISPSLDVVTPQEKFQVYHDLEEKSQPHALYTLGNGQEPVKVVVAIRGVPGKATPEEVDEVWQWVQQALQTQGIGSRTSAGYGVIAAPEGFSPSREYYRPLPNHTVQNFEFQLFSQGCYGAAPNSPELRPTHWRGWLRSWLLRFFLGTMSEQDAHRTLTEIMGGLGADGERAIQGKIRLDLILDGEHKYQKSETYPYFYKWKGRVILRGPKVLLNTVVLPVMRFAATLGGLGRGWRRPLHYYAHPQITRGSQLNLWQVIPNSSPLPWLIQLQPEDWPMLYDRWLTAVQTVWPQRVRSGASAIRAEVFSPTTCAVYAVPGPAQAPIDFLRLEWLEETAVYTRGEGLDLIYQPKYKRKRAVGGDAASGANSSHCSWVSIQQVQQKHPTEKTDFQEIVCLFMGTKNELRQSFLKDLHNISGSIHLFGMTI